MSYSNVKIWNKIPSLFSRHSVISSNVLNSRKNSISQRTSGNIGSKKTNMEIFLSACECEMISHGNQSSGEKGKWLMKNTFRLSRPERIGMYLSYCVCDVQIGISHGNVVFK